MPDMFRFSDQQIGLCRKARGGANAVPLPDRRSGLRSVSCPSGRGGGSGQFRRCRATRPLAGRQHATCPESRPRAVLPNHRAFNWRRSHTNRRHGGQTVRGRTSTCDDIVTIMNSSAGVVCICLSLDCVSVTMSYAALLCQQQRWCRLQRSYVVLE